MPYVRHTECLLPFVPYLKHSRVTISAAFKLWHHLLIFTDVWWGGQGCGVESCTHCLTQVEGDTVTFSFEMRSGREHNTPDKAMWGMLCTVRAQVSQVLLCLSRCKLWLFGLVFSSWIHLLCLVMLIFTERSFLPYFRSISDCKIDCIFVAAE